MTWEPPPPTERRSRPGAAGRRKALGLPDPPVPADASAPAPAPGAPGGVPTATSSSPLVRESLRDSLARIPDLVPGADDATEVAPPAPARARTSITESGLGARVAATGARSVTPDAVPAGPSAPDAGPAAGDDRPSDPTAKGSDGQRRRGATATDSGEASVLAAAAAPALATAASDAPALIDRPSPYATADTPFPSLVGTAVPRSPRLVDAKGRPATVRPVPPWWRRVGFAVLVLGLVAGIPVLGLKGYRIISNSTDGKLSSISNDPSDPGYEAQVDPTPTAAVIQYDAQHLPVGATFLSLTSAAGGGGIVFIPLDTEVAYPAFGINRLRTSYAQLKDRPELARQQFTSEIGRLVNVGVEETIELDDAGWAQVVGPVAPIEIDNPEPVTLVDGTTIPSGNTSLSAVQVGPYLAAQKDGETDVARLNRSDVFWTAWLAKVKAANSPNAVPGETTTGIGRFAQSLAKGDLSVATLPVDRILDTTGRYRIRKADVNALVTDIVPSPTPAFVGSRFTVRLLDGVAPGTVPSDLIRQIVELGGSVSVLGNGPSFGQAKTQLVFSDPALRGKAKLILKALGGTGSVRLDREATDTVDFTIVLGKDILGDDPTPTASTAGATTTVPGATVTGSTPGFTTTSGGT